MRSHWMLAAALVAGGCGGGSGGEAAAVSSADLEHGERLYRATCAMCHGYAGEGVGGLGKPVAGSAFVAERSDAELVQFLIEGRDADHPDNDQGVPMPPRGGNPRLTDEDLAAIVAYMRSLGQ